MRGGRRSDARSHPPNARPPGCLALRRLASWRDAGLGPGPDHREPDMPRSPIATQLAALALCAVAAAAAADTLPADTVYRGGQVYTADAGDHVREAVAIRAGRVVYVGTSAGARHFVGKRTRIVDLEGRFVMPGLVDAHMHPMEGGAALLKCNLEYLRLTVPEFQTRIQACLDKDAQHEPDGWLVVNAWFQQGMTPAGVDLNHGTLDALNTRRPIRVRDSFGHTVLANARALALAGITRDSKDPQGGLIHHDAAGEPNGLLEDAASEPMDALVPALTADEERAAARAALAALARQGVTSAIDADAECGPASGSVAAFTAVEHEGAMTARMHFAIHIAPTDAEKPAAAIDRVLDCHRRYDQKPAGAAPGITVRNAKLFVDGVISGPAFSGTMIEPYLVNAGTAETPHWIPGQSRGPDPYYSAPALADLLVRLARAGIDPHMHADGDGAVRAALDGIEAMRKAVPHRDIRPAIAHDEIVAPADYPRYRALGAYPVLSFEWEKPAPDTVEQLRDYFGPERWAIAEPAGLLLAAGAPVAFGSDWPVDPLNEWFAIKVGVTRENAPDSGYTGRLGVDPGLSVVQALRAATIVSARALHDDSRIGSLEFGKLADLIVLDRNPLEIPPASIADVKVLETVVGGKVVYRAPRAFSR